MIIDEHEGRRLNERKKEEGKKIPRVFLVLFIYEVGHSWKDCNTRPTRGEGGASPEFLASVQKSV